MFYQELRTLEPFGQIAADGFSNHARTGEANQRLGFRDIHIAQHRKGGCNTTRSWVCEQRNVGNAGAIEQGQLRVVLQIGRAHV